MGGIQSVPFFLPEYSSFNGRRLLNCIAVILGYGRGILSCRDSKGESRPGLSFVDDPRNRLHTTRDWLACQLEHRPDLQDRFFSRHRNPHDPTDTRPVLRRWAVDEHFHQQQLFLRSLAFLVYMGAGLPPRTPGLMSVLWCNDTGPRNIYLHSRGVCILTCYHKSQWRVGSRPVARFLPPLVGQLLIRYLVYIPPFLRLLRHGANFPPSLTRGLLFADEDGMWSPKSLARKVSFYLLNKSAS